MKNDRTHGRDLSPEEMATVLDEFVNSHNNEKDLEAFATQVVERTHRTLQQGIMRLFVTTISKWASCDRFDPRNEATVNLSKKMIAATGDKYDRFLPHI